MSFLSGAHPWFIYAKYQDIRNSTARTIGLLDQPGGDAVKTSASHRYSRINCASFKSKIMVLFGCR
jgi:hypothetical protein